MNDWLQEAACLKGAKRDKLTVLWLKSCGLHNEKRHHTGCSYASDNERYSECSFSENTNVHGITLSISKYSQRVTWHAHTGYFVIRAWIWRCEPVALMGPGPLWTITENSSDHILHHHQSVTLHELSSWLQTSYQQFPFFHLSLPQRDTAEIHRSGEIFLWYKESSCTSLHSRKNQCVWPVTPYLCIWLIQASCHLENTRLVNK